jgi:hypothetical protein
MCCRASFLLQFVMLDALASSGRLLSPLETVQLIVLCHYCVWWMCALSALLPAQAWQALLQGGVVQFDFIWGGCTACTRHVSAVKDPLHFPLQTL